MTNVHSVPDEPTDPYDPDQVRYSEAEFTHGDVESRKVLSTILVRKPANRKEWFQLHPGQAYQCPVALYLRDNDEMVRPETYLVLPPFIPLFGKGVTPVKLRLAVNSLGTPFLWDMKMPIDGRMSDHYAVLDEIAEEAEKNWIKLDWNNGSRTYDYHYAKGDLGDPQFPEGRSMRDLLALAFKGDKLINSEDHPVIAEYQGRRT